MEQVVNSIKFFWNGVKINNDSLLALNYYLPHGAEHVSDCRPIPSNPITINKYTWTRDFPMALFDEFGDVCAVASEVVIEPENPLYPYVKQAYMKDQIHQIKRYMKHPVTDDLALRKKQVETLEREVKEMGITHPTKSIIAKTIEYMKEMRAKYQAKKEAIRQAELEERHRKDMMVKAYGEAQYKELAALYPMEKGKHWIELEWSESHGIENGEKMSLIAGDKFLTRMDKNFREVYGEKHGYNKTAYKVHFVDKEGKDISVYEDRYDIGSERRSLLEAMFLILDNYHDQGKDNGMYDIFMKHVDEVEAKGLEEY